MSSTYSSNLRIELIGSGDQAGTWGTTTNSNLAYVLDTAIAGYQAVTVTSTNQALTYVNGPSSTASLNQSVYAMLKFNSAGAASNIYAPPASKQYTIWNNTSYTITIYNSTVIGNTTAAGTGVAIGAGNKVIVWSDGTNFYEVQAQNLTGTLAIANGGTGVTTLTALGTLFYPVGSIYSSVVATNPGTLLGFGTWSQFGAGRMMMGAGGSYAAGSTGGSANAITVSHTHTASSGTQSADHTHTFSGTTGGMSANQTHTHNYVTGRGEQTTYSGYAANAEFSIPFQTLTTASADLSHTHSFSGTTSGVSANHTHAITVDSAGSSGTDANLPPYIVVYMWQRTA